MCNKHYQFALITEEPARGSKKNFQMPIKRIWFFTNTGKTTMTKKA